MSNPIPELLTRVFSLLERSSARLGCGCGGDYGLCKLCRRLHDDIDDLLLGESEKEA